MLITIWHKGFTKTFSESYNSGTLGAKGVSRALISLAVPDILEKHAAREPLVPRVQF